MLQENAELKDSIGLLLGVLQMLRWLPERNIVEG